ncbi:MAG TPA: Mur ligase domain-containing protein, partial [Pseudorhizobium sp.]|nr:Mur ligase domain-containing protein [Pseudorhizobium sp.]
MKLRELAGKDFPEINDILAGPTGDIEIGGLTSDSRKAAPGMLFAAMAGSKADGAQFVADAANNGAFAAVAGASVEAQIPVLVVSNPRRFLALAAARFHGAQPQTIVAVTGTAGKTSVASFTRQIWSHAGMAAAQIGTTGVVSPTRNEYGSLTTPDPVALHA